MTGKTRWGILGTGAIARKFAEGLQSATGAQLLAVGSRASDTAEAFGQKFAVPRRYGSYAELAGDPDVDVIYVATPHPFHLENSLACIEAGKAVLCEKPLTVNARQAERLIKAARLGKVFCMEAMWTRFLPSLVKVRELLAQQAVGEVRMVIADFGFRAGWNPEGRLLNLHYAGGGLLDVGIYPLALASMVLGKPATISSQAHIGATGVDEQAAVVLGYAGGQLATLSCCVMARTPQQAWILGTEGMIHIHEPWWRSTKITLQAGADSRDIDLPMKGNGYNYEAEEVMRCLAAGKLESPTMPLEESLELMRTMDRIRAQWGLKYPME